MVRPIILVATLAFAHLVLMPAALAGGNNSLPRTRPSELDAEAFDRAMQMYRETDRTMERQPWTVAQYDQIIESVGIYTREGQFAALGAVVVALRDRKIQEAARRLDALQNTDGFVLEADIAHQVDALAAIVEHLTVPAEGGAMSAPAVTAGHATPAHPVQAQSTQSTHVAAMKPGAHSVPSATSSAASSAAAPELAEILRRVQSLEAALQARTDGSSTDGDATADDFAKTRVCYTIEVDRYADRELAEQRVEILRTTYSRARLAIDDSSKDPFVVVIGYYPSTEEATKDLRSIGRTTGKLCRVTETTIAERL